MTPADGVILSVPADPPCPRCRPCTRTYTAGITLAVAHHAAGLRQTRCPGCGLWRWPWEWEEPEVRASGLTWMGWRLSGATIRRWSLHRDGRILGYVWRHWASRTWHASVNDGTGLRYLTDADGSLSDCARALVGSVSGTIGAGPG